jgi:Lyase
VIQLLFVRLGRFAQDLNTWTGFEVGHLQVSDGYVQVSSIVPQKRNPVAVEHLRLLCSRAAGRAGATLAVLHNTHSPMCSEAMVPSKAPPAAVNRKTGTPTAPPIAAMPEPSPPRATALWMIATMEPGMIGLMEPLEPPRIRASESRSFSRFHDAPQALFGLF